MIKIRLREERLSKGWSQEKLADLVGMTQCNYSRRENGKKSISDVEWTRIAKALDINKEVIYEDNILITNNNNTINVSNFNIPSFIIEHIKLLKTENIVLKEKLKNFESSSTI